MRSVLSGHVSIPPSRHYPPKEFVAVLHCHQNPDVLLLPHGLSGDSPDPQSQVGTTEALRLGG